MSRSISLQERILLTIDIQTSWSAGRFGGVYGQSKLSNILHANELAGDLRFSNFISTCIKPPRLASGRPNYHCSGVYKILTFTCIVDYGYEQ